MPFIKITQWLRPGTLFLALCFLVPLIFTDGVGAEAFFSAVDFPTTTSEPDFMSSIVARDVKGNLVLQKAAMIFHDKLAQSDALQEAALELIHTCKAAKEIDNGKLSLEKIDLAKKLYAIRATLIDLSGASADHPAACSDLTGTRQDTWYTLWRSFKDGSQGQQAAISGCLKSLFESSNSWTSFKAHGQDANTLCEVPGTENAARVIMNLLNDVNQIIPDWLNAFHAEQEESTKVLERRREILESIVELEQHIKNERLQAQEDTKAHSQLMFNGIDTHIANIIEEADNGMAQMGTGFSQIRQENIAAFEQGLQSMQHESQSFYQTFQAEVLSGLALHQQGINDINDAADMVIASYQDANTGILSQSEAFTDLVRAGMQEATALQLQQLDDARQSLQIQQEILARQQESLALANKLSAVVANIARVFEKAGPALQRLADTFSDLLVRIILVSIGMLVIMHQALFHSVFRAFMVFCLLFAGWYFFETILGFGLLARSWLAASIFGINNTTEVNVPSFRLLLVITTALSFVLMVVIRVFIACRSRLLREGLEEHFEQNEKSLDELERGRRGMTSPL